MECFRTYIHPAAVKPGGFDSGFYCVWRILQGFLVTKLRCTFPHSLWWKDESIANEPKSTLNLCYIGIWKKNWVRKIVVWEMIWLQNQCRFLSLAFISCFRSICLAFVPHISQFAIRDCSRYFCMDAPFCKFLVSRKCHEQPVHCIHRDNFIGMKKSSWKRWNYENRINWAHTLFWLSIFPRWYKACDIKRVMCIWWVIWIASVIMSYNHKRVHAHCISVCPKANSQPTMVASKFNQFSPFSWNNHWHIHS